MTKLDLLATAKQNGHKMSQFKRRKVDGIEGSYEVSVCKKFGCQSSIVFCNEPILKSAVTHKCKDWNKEAM